VPIFGFLSGRASVVGNSLSTPRYSWAKGIPRNPEFTDLYTQIHRALHPPEPPTQQQGIGVEGFDNEFLYLYYSSPPTFPAPTTGRGVRFTL
jgi:hypothetical protein